MRWILQTNIFNEAAYGSLVETLTRFDIMFSEHKVVPFVGILIPATACNIDDVEKYVDHELLDIKGPVICMGSYSMRHAAIRYGWTPGVFDLLESGNFESCVAHWGSHMLNADSVIVPFSEASWPRHEKRFIRPTDDSKYFAGKVILADEFLDWQRDVCVLKLDYGNSLKSDTLIQVAKLKNIYAEYRCWVVKGKIITMSLYKRGSTVIYINMDEGIGAEALAYATKILAYGWQPAEAFCLDVCDADEGWKIVEVNTLNACGFYAANLPALVMALEDAFN